MTTGFQGRSRWKMVGVAGVMASMVGCAATGNGDRKAQQTVPPASQEQPARGAAGSWGRLLAFQPVSVEHSPAIASVSPPQSSGATRLSDTWSEEQIASRSPSQPREPASTAANSPSPASQHVQLAADEQFRSPAEKKSVSPIRANAIEELFPVVVNYTEPESPEVLPPPLIVFPHQNETPESGGTDARDAAFPYQVPINLSYALQLTAGQNPEVGFAKQRIQAAYAQMQLAEKLWVPSIRMGANYNKHDGVIQDVQGNMITNSRSSVYTGFGAQAVGAGSPAVPGLAMNFHLRDAIFAPRITEQALGAQQQATRSATNDVLLDTALRYTDLLEASQVLAVAEDSLQYAEQLTELTTSFAESGQGLQADADRANTELALRRVEVQRSVENVRVASVRLARVLSQQDQSLMLVPEETALIPIDLVIPACPLPDLIATGLSNRPELAENRYLVGEAVERLRRERYAPLVPSVLLGMSYGGNGGSPNSNIDNFDHRIDFDAAVYWEVRNLGFGERYARNKSQAELEQARWRQMQVMDQVASEIAEAHAQVETRLKQIKFSEAGITAAEDSYRRNSERIRDGQGLPIETLQSIQALDQARRQYIRAVADYNRAQFQLQRALGWPIQT